MLVAILVASSAELPTDKRLLLVHDQIGDRPVLAAMPTVGLVLSGIPSWPTA
jgi:hypothetical protein